MYMGMRAKLRAALELAGFICTLYAILELARYIVIYHFAHPDFICTWGLYCELSALSFGLLWWSIWFVRFLRNTWL